MILLLIIWLLFSEQLEKVKYETLWNIREKFQESIYFYFISSFLFPFVYILCVIWLRRWFKKINITEASRRIQKRFMHYVAILVS